MAKKVGYYGDGVAKNKKHESRGQNYKEVDKGDFNRYAKSQPFC